MNQSVNGIEHDAEDWIPEALPIPPHWVYADFEIAFENISLTGLKIPQKEYSSSGEFPIVDQGSELIGGYTDDAEKIINLERASIVFGDHTKCFKYVGFPFAPGADGVKVLVPREPILERFAYYACKSLRLPDRGYSRHYSFLKKSNFPLAPVAEQHRIVEKIEALFSELDKSVESLKTAREQLKVYRQAVLNSAATGQLLVEHGLRKSPFGSAEKVALHQVVQDLGQGWSPRCHNHPSPDYDTWGVIKTTAIQHSKFEKTENKEFPEQLEPRTHLTIEAGDILVTRAGPRKRVGVACLVRSCRPRLMLCDKAYRLRVDRQKIIDEYLEIILNSPRVLQAIEELKTGINDSGVNLTQDRFLSLEVFVPTIDEQKATLVELATVLSNIENAQAQVNDTLQKEAALRQSILKKAFSGQLVPQDPNDEPASVLLERIKAEKAQQIGSRSARNSTRKTRSVPKEVN